MNTTNNNTFDITRDAVIVRLSIGRYGGRVKSSRLSREAAELHGAEATAIDSAIRTLSKEDHAAIDHVVNEARGWWWSLTLPWEEDGRRLCPTTNYQKLVTRLSELKDKFHDEVVKLVDKHASIEAAARKRLGNLIDEAKFPTAQELQERYYWSVTEDVITNLRDVRLSHVNGEQLKRIIEEREARVQQTIVEAQADVALRLAEVLERIVEKFGEDDPTFRDSLIGNVRDAVEVLPSTDGRVLFYNSKFVDALTIEEATWLLLHQSGHVFLGHHLRLADEPQKTKDIAFDLALNEVIKDQMPKGILEQFAIVPGKPPFEDYPAGKSAETYMRLIKKQKQQEQPQGKGEGKGDGEQGEQQPEPKPPEDPTPKKLQGQKTLGEVRPHPDTGTNHENEAQGRWKEMVAEGVNNCRMKGDMPGWLKELTRSLYGKTKLDWRKLLRQFMVKYTRTGFTYTRPNRRTVHRTDIILPARRSRNASRGCVLVDTSGSMSDKDCAKALHEIEGVLRTFNQAEVLMKQCDTRDITESEKEFRFRDFPLRAPQTWFGRGGTDMNPALKNIQKRRLEFKWLIIVTDMVWNYPQAVNPGIPTLWLDTNAQHMKSMIANQISYQSNKQTAGDYTRVPFGLLVDCSGE